MAIEKIGGGVRKTEEQPFQPASVEKRSFWKDVLGQIEAPLSSSSVFSAEQLSSGEYLTKLFFEYIGLNKPAAVHLDKQDKRFLSPVCLTTMDIVRDFSSMGRSVLGVFSADTPFSHLLGEGAVFSFLKGGSIYIRAYKERSEELSKGSVVQDEQGLWLSFAREFQGIAQLAGAFSLMVNRAASLMSSFGEKALRGNRTLGQISFCSGVTGAVFGSFLGTAIGLWSSLGLRDSLDLFKRLGFSWSGEDSPDSTVIERLKEELQVDCEKVREELLEKYPKEYKVVLAQEVNLSVKTFLMKAASYSEKPVSEAWIDHILDAMVQNVVEKTGEIQKEGIPFLADLELKEQLGFLLILQKKQALRDVQMSRSIGKEAMEFITKDSDWSASTLQFVRGQLMQTIAIQGATLLAGALVILAASTALVSCFVLEAPLLLVSCILSVCCALVSAGINGFQLIQSLQSMGPVEMQDKVIAYLDLFIGFACLAGVIALSGASLGTFPAVIALTTGAVWVGVALFNVYALRQQELFYQEEHISVEALQLKLKALASRVSKVEGSEMDKLRSRAFSLAQEGQPLSSFKKRIATMSEAQELEMILEEWKDKEKAVKEGLSRALQQISSAAPREKKELSAWEQLLDSFSWLVMGFMRTEA